MGDLLAAAQRGIFRFEFGDPLILGAHPLLLLDLVQRQLLDFLQQDRLHLTDAHALFGDLTCGRHARQMLVFLDVLLDLAQGRVAVVVVEDIVGPADLIDDHFLGVDRAVDGEFVGSGAGRSDTDVAAARIKKQNDIFRRCSDAVS